MEDLKNQIEKNRPTLNNKSIKTYISTLSSLYKKMNSDKPLTIDFFKNHEEIINFLNENIKSLSTKKTILSALVVLFDDEEKLKNIYRSLMLDNINIYNTLQKKQEKSDTQKENWITQDELKSLYYDLHKNAYHLLSCKLPLDQEQQKRLQNFIILSLYVMIPPRRLRDYTEFKIRNFNPEKDNYMIKNIFIFNDYKTNKKYGRQEVEIPKRLRLIISKYSKLHDNDYLLYNLSNNTKMSVQTLNQRLNQIFKKPISVNILRHSYISENVLKNTPYLDKLEEEATKMGHSVETQMLYKKK